MFFAHSLLILFSLIFMFFRKPFFLKFILITIFSSPFFSLFSSHPLILLHANFLFIVLTVVLFLSPRPHLWHLQQAPSRLLRGAAGPGHDWWCQHPLEGGPGVPEEAWPVNSLSTTTPPTTLLLPFRPATIFRRGGGGAKKKFKKTTPRVWRCMGVSLKVV